MQRDVPLRHYVVNITSSAATRVLQLTVLVWVNQYLLRRIEPEEYSLFPLVMSLMIFGEVVRNVFTGGLARFIVEADARGDHDEVGRITSSMLPVLIVATAALAAAGGAAIWGIDRLLSLEPHYVDDARLMLALLVAPLALNLLAAPYTLGLYVRQRFVVSNLIELGCEALRIVLLLALLFGVSTQVLWLVVASAVSSVVNLACRYVSTRRLVPAIRFRRDGFSLLRARRLTGFGAWTSVEGLIELASKTVPLLILNRFSTPVQVASFHLGRLADLQLRRIISSAAQPMQPVLTSLYAQDGRGVLTELYYRGGRYTLWFALILIAPLVVLAEPLMVLYAGHEYSSAGVVMFALLAGYPCVFASAMFYRVAHAVGQVGSYYVTQLVVQAVVLAGTAAAVLYRPEAGAAGAAIAIGALNAFLHLVLIWPRGLQLVGGRWRRFLRESVVPGTLPWLVALLVCYALSRLVSLDSWPAVGFCAAASVAVYVATLFGLCLDAGDRQLVQRGLRRFRRGASPVAASAEAA